ncbi:MAG: ATP synthase F1 subunit epsilon [candidate division Zixibacteria bacterium]|nr:ATP synthase F1 subunit epsilon [candidate division Zixibacteria bacterium]
MYRLKIVTPVKVFYDDEVNSITAPGKLGYLGALTGHAPIITTLQPGLLTVRNHLDTISEMAVSGGFLEISNNVATILADSVEYLSEIDLERAQAAIKRSRDRIKGLYTNEETDQDRSAKSLARALNRVNLASRLKN